MMSTISFVTKMNQNLHGFPFKGVEKPLRYTGGELNSVVKESAPARMLLAFPDIYEIGMSHFGSRILYEVVNWNSEYGIERVYMPWKDAYYEMKSNHIPLSSLETGRNFRDFDAVGFSLQHELSYTNVLAMLELGGIELLAARRDSTCPIILAGGGAVFNPAPMVDFIDAFVVGEADHLILDILEVLKNSKDRNERLKELSKLQGIYVPLIHSSKDIIEKSVVSSMNDTPVISHPLVPYLDLVHNRITYEVQRGCSRGCRFCQAGFIYRPVRQRSPESIIESIEKDLSQTGYRDIGFLSLNACDYPPLLNIVEWIYKTFKGRGIYVSLPSLRIESIDKDFLEILSKLPKGGFTIAPEAGSSRLRKVINKDITEEETLATVELVSKLGWESIKSYFMLGQPTEGEEDIEAAIDLIYEMEKKLSGKRSKLTVSVSNFIPKPHTPFQWESQLPWEEIDKKLTILNHKVRGRKLSFKWSDPKMSEIEGMLSRGDERIGELVFSVYKKGEVFTGWGSEFDYLRWSKSMEELGINRFDYLSSRNLDLPLPWSNISSGVDTKWLRDERDRAYSTEKTDSCIEGDCCGCGICLKSGLRNEVVSDVISTSAAVMSKDRKSTDKKYRMRCIFSKVGKFRWMGHFELMDAVEKAMLRADLPLSVSRGFKPSPHLSFSPPVGAGVESLVELVDVFLFEHVSEKDFIERINSQLPAELAFKKVWGIPNTSRSIYQDIERVLWSATIPLRDIGYLSVEDRFIEIKRKGKIRKIKLSDFVREISSSVSGEKIIINFSISFVGGKTIKPIEVLEAIIPDISEDDIILIRREVILNGIDYNY